MHIQQRLKTKLHHLFFKCVDWTFFVPHIVLFGLTLVVFDPLQRLALVTGGVDSQQRVVRALNRLLVVQLAICGIKINRSGFDSLDPNRQYIFIANHQSLYDIPLLFTNLLPLTTKFVAKEELASWVPSVSYNLRHGGHVIIDRSNPKAAIKAINQFADSLKKPKFSALIFPEGTRSRTGTLAEFRFAGVSTLIKKLPDAVVVPIAISGTWALSRGLLSPIPFGATVSLKVCPEIDRNRFDNDPNDIIKQAYEAIKGAISINR